MNSEIILKVLRWLLPLAIIGAGFLIGILIERLIMRRLERLPREKTWKGLRLIIKVLHRIPLIWCGIAGVAIATKFLPIGDDNIKIINNILLVIIIFSAVIVVSRITAGLIRAQAQRSDLPSVSIFVNLSKVLIFIIGFLIVLQTLGVSIAPILTALGVGGLAVALALQDTLSNLFAGVYIIATKLVVPGDYVQLDSGQEGYVSDVTWRNTTIRSIENNMVIIPNAKLSSTILTNFNQPIKELSVRVQVGVHYDSDLDLVERVVKEVAAETMHAVPGAIPTAEPLVRFHTFGDSSINLTAILKARDFISKYPVQHDFVKRLHKRFQQEKIEIPFPIRTVYMRGGAKSAS